MSQFHLIRPEVWLLLPPLLLLLFWLKQRKHQLTDWQKQVDAELLPYVVDQQAGSRTSPVSWHIAALLIALFALSGPSWNKQPQPVFSQQKALIIALDLSRSMLAADIKPNRLQRAKFIIQDILKQQQGGQFALIVFAGESFVVTPLSTDKQTLVSQLQALSPDIMPTQGSNIAQAIKKAEQLKANSGIRHARLLIISDTMAQNPISELRSTRLPISLYLLATPQGAPIPDHQGHFIKDQQGNIVLSKLNGDRVKQLASLPDIRFRVFGQSDRDLAWLLPEQSSAFQLKKDTRQHSSQWKDQGALFAWLLLPYLVLWFRKGLIFLLLLAVVPVPRAYSAELPAWMLNQNQQALRAYQQQHYDQAAKTFSDPQWQASSLYRAGKYQQAEKIWQQSGDAQSLYNAGNAAAKSRQYQKAIDYYQKALKKQPDFPAAQANLDAIKAFLQRQKQQAKPQQAQQPQNSQNNPQQQKQQNQSAKNRQKPAEKASAQNGNNSKQAEKRKQARQASKGSTPQQPKNNTQKNKPNKTQTAKKPQKPAEQGKQDHYQVQKQHQLNKTEQWLQQIPDDPGGLLRRKFYYYSQQPQQSNQQQPW